MFKGRVCRTCGTTKHVYCYRDPVTKTAYYACTRCAIKHAPQQLKEPKQ